MYSASTAVEILKKEVSTNKSDVLGALQNVHGRAGKHAARAVSSGEARIAEAVACRKRAGKVIAGPRHRRHLALPLF